MSRSSTRPKPKKRRSTKQRDAGLVSAQRKKEVFGLVLMALALLVTLALVTYSPADDALADAFSWRDALRPGGASTDNALGLIGAALSHALVPHFLGYPVVLLALLLGAWGYVFFRQRTTVFLPILSLLALVVTFLASTLFGWFADGPGTTLALWSGEVGLGVAGWMTQLVGATGSLILLIVAAIVALLLIIDRDIQITLDRAEASVTSLRSSAKQKWGDARDASARRKKARQAHTAERRSAREAKVKERKSGRAEERKRAEREKREEKEKRERKAPVPTPPVVEAPTPAEPPTPEPKPHPATPATRPAAPKLEPTLRVQGPVEEAEGDLGALHQQPTAATLPYDFPPIDLLDEPDASAGVDYDEIEENKQVLLDKLETYKVEITEINAVVGPTVTRYELTPAPGVRISRITALEDDLAMAMAAPGIRILAPIPGKSAIGVEIPNRQRELVRLRSVLGTARFTDAKMDLPVALGKNIQGEVSIEDLARMPHLLIAGATGAGKSVGLNGLVVGLLYACHPADLKFVMIDPKKIELGPYQVLLDHFLALPEGAEDPIITDFTQAAGVLKSCEREMEDRYDLLAEAGVRGIKEYNAKVRAGELSPEDDHRHLPYIVVIIDELADLMMTSGKEVEPPIARLAQMARAVGIHLVLATQRPSVDVITGLIKANFPSRMAFQTSSKIDSRTILDTGGAQQLVGNGDLLYMNGSRMTRLQGPFVSNAEIEQVVTHIGGQKGAGPYLLPPLETEESTDVFGPTSEEDRDDLFEDAARVIVRSQQGSVSLLQRKLSVGYTRAARIVDQLEDAGIVGPFEGSKARDVLVGDLESLEMLLHGEEEVEDGE
ncbi:MAG: DNA translocase FtsK 4TM domain-containing protein [Bacteroidota bacterium]